MRTHIKCKTEHLRRYCNVLKLSTSVHVTGVPIFYIKIKTIIHYKNKLHILHLISVPSHGCIELHSGRGHFPVV